jgi:hypothetical protein
MLSCGAVRLTMFKNNQFTILGFLLFLRLLEIIEKFLIAYFRLKASVK